MPLCAAVNCSNRFEDGFRLFLLPTDENRKKQWLINIGRENWTPSKISCVCEVHFDNSQWVQNESAGWKKLKPNAIPTLFNNQIIPVFVKETDVVIPNFLQICRICLSSNNYLIELFKSSSNNKPPYLELMEYTFLQVSSDDGLPPYICNECFETLQGVKNFKEKCINSANLLKHYNGPNTIESFNEYIISKTQPAGIWYIDNEENLELITEDNINKQYQTEEIIDLTILPDPIERKTIRNERYLVCDICGKLTKNIRIHLKTHINSLDLKCDICGKQFRHNITLRSHLAHHKREEIEGKPECDICHKTFYCKAGLDRHIKNMHQNTRPIKCTLCPKSFHDIYVLKVHMVTHTGERRYKCDVEGCSRTYTQRTPLVQHKLKYHSNNESEITKFKCKICSKRFKYKRNMEEHLRFHNGVRCNKCNKLFTSSKKLKKHIREHFGTIETESIEAKDNHDPKLLESIDNLIQQELCCTQKSLDFLEAKV